MIETAGAVASAARIGRSLWLWPILGALLAAWPVWRSFFAEVPDIGSAPLRGQIAAALGELVLVGSWVARYRERIAGFNLPLFAMGFAVIVLVMAATHGDAPTADLAALAICWLAVVFLFAGVVLLDGQRAFAAVQGGAVPAVSMLLRAHERIGYWLLGVALVAATIQETPQGFLLAALAAVSPGAVLIWAALCDTARSVLARRRVHVGDLAALPALAASKAVIFGDPGMLIANRPKVISIMPVGESKPGEIVAVAAGLLAEDEGDAARGVQDFGVAHRLRVPAIKPLEAGAPALRRGRLPDRRVAEVGAIEHAAISEDERAPFADRLARAAELHRLVLALTEVQPSPRLLGLMVLAKAARPGAAEAVRTLRKAGFTVALANAETDPRDREALHGLALAGAQEPPPAAIGLIRPGQAPLASCTTTIHLGARVNVAEEPVSDIVIARDDPRALVDLLQFARDFRVRTRIAIIVANLPGLALLSAAFGYVPASPLFVTGAALAGIALGVAMPQALRLSPTIANEVDEE
jgi:cation transport ATPase